jgi:RNA polymerase sigma-70 factor (ECF subfamily)
VGASFVVVNDAHARGRARWPDLALNREAFRHYVERVQADDDRLGAHGEDLYLVAAVLDGVRGALPHFDTYLSTACLVAARIDAGREFLDDVKQELGVKLLTGGDPKLKTYAGAGPLADWLRVAALRAAINLKRSDRLLPTEEPPVNAMLDGFESAPFKTWYRADFQRALEKGFERLSPRDRILLRLHFVDGLNIDRIGVMYGVHRATVARWLVTIRERLFEDAKTELGIQHGLDTQDVKSLYRLLEREVHVTISRILRA